MKKRILPMLTAVGISATGMAGLYCALTALSCFMDGDPGRYPVAFPASVLAGLLCLALFALLIWSYIRQRRENPSTLCFLIDLAAALGLLALVLVVVL